MDRQGMKGIEVVWDKKDHIYKINGTAPAQLDKFILENTSIEDVSLNPKTGEFESAYTPIEKITSDEMYKVVFKKRTALNNKAKEIDKKRKQAIAIMINDFQNYCKGIVDRLDYASNQLTTLLNEYKPKEKSSNKVKKTMIAVKTTDLELVAQIEKLAQENNAEYEIKEVSR